MIDHDSLGRHFVLSRAAKLLSLRFCFSLHVFVVYTVFVSYVKWFRQVAATAFVSAERRLLFCRHFCREIKRFNVFANSFFIPFMSLNCIDGGNAIQGVQTSGCALDCIPFFFILNTSVWDRSDMGCGLPGFLYRVLSPRGGGVLPKKLGRGVRPASQNPYPIYDQNLQFSLPYL